MRALRSCASAAASPAAACETRAAVRPPSKIEYCTVSSGTLVVVVLLKGSAPKGVLNSATGLAYANESCSATLGRRDDADCCSRAREAMTPVCAVRYPGLRSRASETAASSESGVPSDSALAGGGRIARPAASAAIAAMARLRIFHLAPCRRRHRGRSEGQPLTRL